MNDTNNTTPGVGGMTSPSVPQTTPIPETPVVPPFSAAPVSPITAPAAPVSVPSFAATDTSVPAPSTPTWTPPTPSPATTTFSSPVSSSAPAPVAGSATWGASSMSSPATPAWTAPSSPIPPTPVVPSTPMTSNDFKPEHEGKSKLPLVIAGILLILAMAGGYFLYMLYQTPTATQETAPIVEAQMTPTTMPSPTMTEEEQAQQEIDALENVSESDEVEMLQKDVDDTDLSTVDSNLTPAAQ